MNFINSTKKSEPNFFAQNLSSLNLGEESIIWLKVLEKNINFLVFEKVLKLSDFKEDLNSKILNLERT